MKSSYLNPAFITFPPKPKRLHPRNTSYHHLGVAWTVARQTHRRATRTGMVEARRRRQHRRRKYAQHPHNYGACFRYNLSVSSCHQRSYCTSSRRPLRARHQLGSLGGLYYFHLILQSVPIYAILSTVIVQYFSR